MVWNYSFTDATMFSLIQKRQQEALTPRKLFRVATGSQHYVQRLKLDRKLEVHDGCVNTVCWNEQGSLLLSGSDDQHLVISDPFNGKIVAKIRSGHRSNIFSAKFLPNSMDRELVSCSGSGEIFYTDVDREDTYGTNRFDCHFGTTYKIVVVPNEAATFLSCGDDGTVRFFDLRVKTSCTKFNCEEDVVINLRDAVSAMAVDPVIPFQMVVGSADGIVRIYDRRMLKMRESGGSSHSLISRFQSPSCASEKRHYRITSLNYRPGSHDVLVNYSSENIYLFNTYDLDMTQSFAAQPLSMGETSKTANELNATRMSGGNTDDEPSTSGAAAAANDNGHDVSGVYKPIKRLRLRGDWSDTGPDARPESEDPAPTNLIMQRMSDLLTRMLNSHGSSRLDEGENSPHSSDIPPSDSDSASRDRVPTTSQASSTNADPTTAAAMLRSVMLTSTGNGVRARPSLRRENTESERYSISSEGLVTPELSSQDYDSIDAATTQQHQVLAREKPEDLGGFVNAAVDSSSTSDDIGQAVVFDTNLESSDRSDISTKLPACEMERLEQKNVSASQSRLGMFVNTGSLEQRPSGYDVDNRSGGAGGIVERKPDLTSFSEETGTQAHTDEQEKMVTSSNNFMPPRRNDEGGSDHLRDSSPGKPTQNLVPESCMLSGVCMNHDKSCQCMLSPQQTMQCSMAKSSQSTLYSNNTTYQRKSSTDFTRSLKAEESQSVKLSSVSHSSEMPNSDCIMTPRNMRDEVKIEQSLMDEDYSLPGTMQSSSLHELSGSKIADNSSASLSQSSYSDIAIAEGNMSSCEGDVSQQTLDDVSMITSWGTMSSFSEKFSRAVTPESQIKDMEAPLGPSGSFHYTRIQDKETKQAFSQGQNESFIFSSVDVEAIETLHLEDCEQMDNSNSVRNQSHNSTCSNSEDRDKLECAKCLQKGKDPQPFSEASNSKVDSKFASHAEKEEEEKEGAPVSMAAFDETASVPLMPSGKGKGIGKSSNGKKGKGTSQQPSRIYAPYNSGNMKYSSSSDERSDIHVIPDFLEIEQHRSESRVADSVPSTKAEDEAGPSLTPKPAAYDERHGPLSVETEQSVSAGEVVEEAVAMTPEAREQPCPSSNSTEQSATRQRRTGYSLPPTGDFQLFADDDDDEDDDDDDEEKNRRRRESNDNERMGRAASKIQELFRRKRQASEAAKLKELPQPRVLMKFAGHRNCRTMIKEANFYGDDYVMSGSDCGRILLWERLTGRLVMYLEADRHVVNCVQPNPVFPLIASSGIDYDIKVWAPLEEDSQFDEDVAEMIIRRNELMLVETRDTITVPAAFMLRVLASLSQIRTGRSSSGGQNQNSQEQSSQD